MVRVRVEPIQKPLVDEDGAALHCNNNNHHEYTPFIVTTSEASTNVEIDPLWWNSLPDAHRASLTQVIESHKCGVVILEQPFIVPHTNNVGLGRDGVAYALYSAFIDLYVFEEWSHLIENARLVNVSTLAGQMLKELSYKQNLRHGRMVSEDDVEELPQAFVQNLNTALLSTLETEPSGCFVKTSQKSSKNDVGITPVFTVADVLQQLTSSRDVLAQSFEKTGSKACQSIVVQPWRPAISSRNELRVFVEQRRVVAISQQKWMRYEGISVEDCLSMAEAVVELYEGNIRDAAPNYASCVLDVWVDLEEEEEEEQQQQQQQQQQLQHEEGESEVTVGRQAKAKAHLIEINPGELWASSGSALFDWIEDAAVFSKRFDSQNGDSDCEIVFRFVTNETQDD